MPVAGLVSITVGGDGSGIVALTLGSRGLSGGFDEPFPLNVPVLLTNRRMAAHLGRTGTLPMAMAGILDRTPFVYVVRVAEGETLDETMTAIIGGTDPGTGRLTGIAALLETRAEMKSRILIAPGFSRVQTGGRCLAGRRAGRPGPLP